MSLRGPRPRSVDDLTAYLFADEPDEPGAGALATEMSGWLESLPRFRDFAERHRDKIRKKLRSARDVETQFDVRAELRVARLLLTDRRIELAFEAYGSQRGGPDFTVTYRTTRQLNLEVTRVRRQPDVAGIAASVLAKLRQLPPSVPNAVLLSVADVDPAELDVGAAAKLLRGRADARDEAFFADRGLSGTRAFYERFLRLGGVFVLNDAGAATTAGPATTATL